MPKIKRTYISFSFLCSVKCLLIPNFKLVDKVLLQLVNVLLDKKDVSFHIFKLIKCGSIGFLIVFHLFDKIKLLFINHIKTFIKFKLFLFLIVLSVKLSLDVIDFLFWFVTRFPKIVELCFLQVKFLLVSFDVLFKTSTLILFEL